MDKLPAVYIMSNKVQGTLYVGVTSNLVQRVWQHKHGVVTGFTARYHLHRLVYFEMLEDMYCAISREKQLKNWKRDWKIQLIESVNPQWNDLWEIIADGGAPSLR